MGFPAGYLNLPEFGQTRHAEKGLDIQKLIEMNHTRRSPSNLCSPLGYGTANPSDHGSGRSAAFTFAKAAPFELISIPTHFLLDGKGDQTRRRSGQGDVNPISAILATDQLHRIAVSMPVQFAHQRLSVHLLLRRVRTIMP